MTAAQLEMRHKSKLRLYGWAGETNDREADYIRGWLQGKMDKYGVPILITIAGARKYARGE